MSKADGILDRARGRANLRERTYPYTPADGKAANEVFHKQKGALTRAINSKSTDAVVLACKKAVDEWRQPPFNGAWPDAWSRWQRALDDVLGSRSVNLEDL